MRKMRMTGRVAIAVVSACLGLSVLAWSQIRGLLQSGEYRLGSVNGITQPGPAQPSPESVYSVGPYLRYTADLAPGDGRDLVHVYCQLCHTSTYITMQPPLPAATWEAEVQKMIQTHGASLPEDAVVEIINYLNAHYTPEARKQ